MHNTDTDVTRRQHDADNHTLTTTAETPLPQAIHTQAFIADSAWFQHYMHSPTHAGVSDNTSLMPSQSHRIADDMVDTLSKQISTRVHAHWQASNVTASELGQLWQSAQQHMTQALSATHTFSAVLALPQLGQIKVNVSGRQLTLHSNDKACTSRLRQHKTDIENALQQSLGPTLQLAISP